MSAATRISRDRGTAEPCARCGNPGGRARERGRPPVRYSVAKFGLDTGRVCESCYGRIQRAWKQKQPAAGPAPPAGTAPAPELPLCPFCRGRVIPVPKLRESAVLIASRRSTRDDPPPGDVITPTDRWVAEYDRAWKRIRPLCLSVPLPREVPT